MAYKLYHYLKVTGCTAPSGDLYAIIEQNGKEWFVRHQALMTDPARTIQSLSKQGLVSVGRGFAAQVLPPGAGGGAGGYVPVKALHHHTVDYGGVR